MNKVDDEQDKDSIIHSSESSSDSSHVCSHDVSDEEEYDSESSEKSKHVFEKTDSDDESLTK